MKLLFCTECHDVMKLRHESISCECGRSFGWYLKDGLNARYGGKGILLGLDNIKFRACLEENRNFPERQISIRNADVWVIPKNSTRIQKVTREGKRK